MQPDVLSALRDNMSPRTVFGEPITRDGLTLIPVARVGGAVGSGGKPGGEGDPKPGGGAADGGPPATTATYLYAKGLGVFVVKDGHVRWQPAFDLNRVILGGQLAFTAAALLVARALSRSRRRRRDRLSG